MPTVLEANGRISEGVEDSERISEAHVRKRLQETEMQVTDELARDELESAAAAHESEEQTPAYPISRVSSSDRLGVEVNILAPNDGRPSNTITTARFTLLSFLPIFIIIFLHPTNNFANFYFFIVGWFQMIPSVTLTDGTPSIWSTLVFIGTVEIIIMSMEDHARHRADREANNQPVGIIRREGGGVVREEKSVWANVQVGDVVRVASRQAFPADLLLLRGSDPPGQCWVNTKPLDGESDLKLRLAPKALHDLAADGVSLENQFEWDRLRGTVRCEAPNDKVNDFMGQVQLDGRDPAMVDETNVLLRGCMLQNTEWILGLVLSTGIDTKINFTGDKKPKWWQVAAEMKVGKLSQLTNKLVTGSVTFMLFFCIFGATLHEGEAVEMWWWSRGGGLALGSGWWADACALARGDGMELVPALLSAPRVCVRVLQPPPAQSTRPRLSVHAL